jgi:hypothetical protein
MIRVRAFAGRLASLFCRKRLDEDLDREIAFHLDELTRKLAEGGLDPHSARREALRQFGGIDQTAEAYRDQRGFRRPSRYCRICVTAPEC